MELGSELADLEIGYYEDSIAFVQPKPSKSRVHGKGLITICGTAKPSRPSRGWHMGC